MNKIQIFFGPKMVDTILFVVEVCAVFVHIVRISQQWRLQASKPGEWQVCMFW